MTAADIKILDDMESSVNRYVNDYDPCPICANKTAEGHVEICHDCAYFYAGQFKARRYHDSNSNFN